MTPVNLLLVGCGMMGARHVRGLGELERVLPGSVRLAAVCDRREDYASDVADEAQELFGARPAIYADIDQALAGQPALQAVDLVTDPRSHDGLAVKLLGAGLDVICEKPLAVTVERGRRMVDAAQAAGRILAVAENNRRDPTNRLARALLGEGVIGQPNFALQVLINPANRIIGTAWRHRLAMGGVLLDVAIHVAYIMEYLLGPVTAVTAQTQQVQHALHGKEFNGNEVDVEVDSEDCCTALLEFAGGAQGHVTAHFASPGETMYKRLLIGSAGTLNLPGDRSGGEIELRRGCERVSGEGLLELVPEYRLNEAEALLFGQRPAGYALDWPVVDRKLIAAEMHDFVTAVRERRSPETDGEAGLRSLAIIHAMMESALAGRRVTMDEVLAGRVRAYQNQVENAAA
ncbi:MAG: Gfo/Idh/MocA family oxidoreductase [Armatimonadia bacterium]